MLSSTSAAPGLATADPSTTQSSTLAPADASDVQQFNDAMGTADALDAVLQNGVMIEGINEMCRITAALKDDFKS